MGNSLGAWKYQNHYQFIIITKSLMWPRDKRAMWLYGKKFLVICNYPVRFGSHKYCGGGDKMLIYYVTSWVEFFWNKSPFSGHRPCGSKGTTAKIAYMNVQDQLIKKRSEDFIEGNSSLHTHTAKIDNHRHCINDYLIICCVILQDHLIIWSCDFKGKSHSK